jgi:hypothetical protein
MRNLLIATGGKVFTLATVRHIVEHTDIKLLATRTPPPEPEPSTGGAPDVVGAEYEMLTKAAEKAIKEDGEPGPLV